MKHRASTRSTTRRTLGLLVITAAIAGIVHQTSALSVGDVLRGDHSTTGQQDGALPGQVSVFDDQYAGVANLNPELLTALRQAATEAADVGITFNVNSGWRSAAYQSKLLREAVVKYGSEREAARWVATPQTSPHVAGKAVDIGRSDATAWLSENGVRYGLCQIYRNEPWHYELRPEAITDGCPPLYPDPSHDPRMHR